MSARTARLNRRPAPARMPGEERRRAIARFVEQRGRASVNELAERFDVSVVTVRTDLKALAGSGVLARSHGGALPTLPVPDTPVGIKQGMHAEAKSRIARAAAELVRDGETIILDSGTTTAAIARRLRTARLSSLTVITNAFNIALELSGRANIRVMMPGGMLRPMSYSLVGPTAEQALSGLSADRCFLGVDGLDADVGITTPEPMEAALNALMIRISRQVVGVADASKLGRRSLSVIAPTNSLDLVITDDAAVPQQLQALRGQGIEVVLV